LDAAVPSYGEVVGHDVVVESRKIEKLVLRRPGISRAGESILRPTVLAHEFIDTLDSYDQR
jgi:hypothetical protein